MPNENDQVSQSSEIQAEATHCTQNQDLEEVTVVKLRCNIPTESRQQLASI